MFRGASLLFSAAVTVLALTQSVATSVMSTAPNIAIFQADQWIFVRSPFGAGRDKVWRIALGEASIDLLGERAIPMGTPDYRIGPAYFHGESLRDGNDEAPPLYNRARGPLGKGFSGGLHGDVSNYRRAVMLDGKPPSKKILSGRELAIVETYDVPDAHLVVEHTFAGDGYVRFNMSVTSDVWMDATFSGMQAQRPVLAARDQLVAEWDGNRQDVTPLQEFTFPAGASRFDFLVKRDGRPRLGLVMAFDSHQNRGDPQASLYISKYGKLYPRGFESSNCVRLAPGVEYRISGYYGTYIP